MLLKRLLPFIIAMLSLPFLMNAQQTTGTITGSVRDANGQSLAGATVTAMHLPTGTKYVTVAKNEGQFTLPNLRIGGPYTITVHFTGYGEQQYTDQNVALGTPLNLNAILNSTSQVLTAVTVTGGRGSIINSQRTGTSTNISSRQIQNLPTINRNIQDFARLTPQAKAGTGGPDGTSTGISFAGQSNRYNQFSIDGANASDAFGLGSTGTNGGQANLNPISIESIQEIQIVLAPYDVTQGGFTGGGINAVTKSGTNKLHGSLYGQYQNQSFVGKGAQYNSSIIRQPYVDFKNETFGASLGGPIIKNKLFFFASAERFKKTTPLAFDPTISGSGSKVNPDTLQVIKDFMLKNYGYDLGSYSAITNENQSTSLFGRIDWNITDKHRLTLRHNYVNGSNDNRSRSAQTALFENTGYKFTDKSNSSVMELNSTFSSSVSNVLRLTYNTIRDQRISKAIPNIAITNFDLAQNASITYNLGSDFSSAANSLDQNIFTVTDNLTLYKGKHTFTFGTNDEFFKSTNVFLQAFYGAYTYSGGTGTRNNLTNFFNNTGLTTYQVGYSTAGRGDKAPAILQSAQLSAYAQDVWSATKNFKLTYGLRVDMPYIKNQPAENTAFNAAFASLDVKTNQMPKRRLMYSPRVGFNWNLDDEALQIRGGLGLFTGRIPFVWISNQFSNTGVATKNLTFNANSTPTLASLVASGDIKFRFDPNDPQLGAYIPAAGAAAPTAINVIDKNFKFPQVFRANLAADRKLGSGFISTLEVVFTKNVNNAFYQNLNISDNGESTVAIGPTTRPYWSKQNLNTNFAQVIKLSNTSKGYSFNFTAQLQKTYSKGWAGSIAYTFGTATSLNDVPSSVALSNWRGTQSVNGLNKLELARSNFDVGSHVTGFLSKEFRYAQHFGTTFTVFYDGRSGQGLSYIYSTTGSRNITGEDNSFTSLAYIPATQAEANLVDITGGKTASQQWADYQSFVASNSYLQKHAGENAARNGDRTPFENHFDVRISQDFLLKNHKLSVFFDVVNVGALLNKNWGRSYGVGSFPDGFFPQTTNLFAPVTSGAQKSDGVAVTPTVNNPAFQFNINNFTKIGNDYRPFNVNNFTSRYNSQIGARYNF